MIDSRRRSIGPFRVGVLLIPREFPSKSSRRGVNNDGSIVVSFVRTLWNLQIEMELIILMNRNEMIRDIIGIIKGFSLLLYGKNIKVCSIKKGDVLISMPFRLLSEKNQELVLAEVKEKDIFLDQVILSTSRRAKGVATPWNYKGRFHRA